jgi:hypothetical protein
VEMLGKASDEALDPNAPAGRKMSGSTNQILCAFCGTTNRIGRLSVKKRPWCGKCGKPLTEPWPVRALRIPYRFPRWTASQ